MCAIFGLAFFHGHKVSNNVAVSNAVKRFLEVSEVSGRRASGVALMRERAVKVLRKPVSGSDFAKDPDLDSLLEENIVFDPPSGEEHSGTLQSIIGHCRFPTKGSERVNANNHPIVVNNIVGVHNGTISNDDELFQKYALSRIAQVDTEAIFQLAAYYTRSVTSKTSDAIKNFAPQLMGGYACAMLNARQPYHLYLFRNNPPINIHYWSEIGMLAFSTREIYMNEAMEAMNEDDLGPRTTFDLMNEMGMTINLHSKNFVTYSLRKGK